MRTSIVSASALALMLAFGSAPAFADEVPAGTEDIPQQEGAVVGTPDDGAEVEAAPLTETPVGEAESDVPDDADPILMQVLAEDTPEAVEPVQPEAVAPIGEQPVAEASPETPETEISMTVAATPAPVQDISGAQITGLADKTYTGSAITQKGLKVVLDGKTLSAGDYKVSYKDNIKAGRATVDIDGIGNYSGHISASFNIKKANIAKASFDFKVKCSYTGKQKKPKPTVSYNGKVLSDGPDYILSYSNNVNAGTAKVVVKSKGSFTGKKTLTFKIDKGKNSIQAVGKTKSIPWSKFTKTVKKAVVPSGGYGKTTYEKISGNRAFSVNQSNGDITVKPMTAAGTYPLRIRVHSAGDANHVSKYVTRIATIKVKGDPLESEALSKLSKSGSSTSYGIAVNLTRHRAVIAKNTNGKWAVIKNWICSTGAPGSETPTGTYETQCKVPSFGHGYTCYWATGFIGSVYLFHSGIYEEGTYNIRDGRLGEEVSGGCVRFELKNAKWLYDHVPLGTKVLIYY